MKKKYIAYIGIPVALIGIGLITRIDGTDSQNGAVASAEARAIDVIRIGDQGVGATLTTTGSVVSDQEAELKAQASGQVTSVRVRVGDTVASGATLATLNASDLAAQRAQAEATVAIQEAALAELERNSVRGNDIKTIETQQETLIENAYRALLNNDLRAYPQDDADKEDGVAPTISGTYTSLAEGTYIIETYGSGAASGASFILSGLETDRQAVGTVNATPLGTRGLYVTFPDVEPRFLKDQTWVVEIPNRRSAGFTAAQSAYNAAKNGKNVALQQSTVSEQRLDGARAQVAQAKANLQAVDAQLAKTVIRAPFGGEVISMPIKVGEYVSIGQSAATLINTSGVYVQSFMSSDESRLVQIGDTVLLNDEIEGVVAHVAAGISDQTGKVEVLIEPKVRTQGFVVGEFVDVAIQTRENTGASIVTVPLTAVKPQTVGSVVYVVEDGAVREQSVTTGSIIGESIEILSGVESGSLIASSVRGLRDALPVRIKE